MPPDQIRWLREGRAGERIAFYRGYAAYRDMQGNVQTLEFTRLKEQEAFTRIIERIEGRRITISVLDPSKELEEALSPMLERERERSRKSGATLTAEYTRWMDRNELRMDVRWKNLWLKLSGGQRRKSVSGSALH
jgi:predicted TIM-barrel fold metal-dependent hydrolase